MPQRQKSQSADWLLPMVVASLNVLGEMDTEVVELFVSWRQRWLCQVPFRHLDSQQGGVRQEVVRDVYELKHLFLAP